MRKEYDFSDAVRHPLAGKFNGKYSVMTHYDFTVNDAEAEYDFTVNDVEAKKKDKNIKKPSADNATNLQSVPEPRSCDFL